MTKEELIKKWRGINFEHIVNAKAFESDLDKVLRELFNRGYAAGIFHNADNPNSHSQRNKAYEDYVTTK